MLAFLATLYYSCRMCAWALRACGEWGWTVGVLSVLWLAASLLNACRTMSPPQNRPPLKVSIVIKKLQPQATGCCGLHTLWVMRCGVGPDAACTVCTSKRMLYLPQADPVTWAGVKPAAPEQPMPVESAAAAGGLANGRAHSGSLRGSKAVQRSSSNNLAATAIS